jgi:hypothetical protein
MKMPRFRIAWVMVFVAVAALNLTVFRAAEDLPFNTSALLVGAMPMASVLAIGLIFGYRWHGSRPFLLGFESFGLMALAFFVVLAVWFYHETVGPYVSLFIEPLAKIIGRDRDIFFISVAYPVAVVALGLPQMAFALMGGFLSRKYRITITKRPARLSADR